MFIRFLLITVCIIERAAFQNTSDMAKNLPKTMRAVGLYKYLPITEADSLIDLEVSLPTLQKTDVLIEVKAVGVNPIDAKQRAPKPQVEKTPRILGWDGSGVVIAKGDSANIFKVGDEVFFTGDLRKNGANAQYVALNEVLVGIKPKNLSFEQAAAMPLTAVTAYESLFDRLLLTEKDKGKTLLIINSAGGVGSIASQLAKTSGLKVIGTASRPETIEFSRQNGADIVLNHTQDLLPQLDSHGYKKGVDFIMVNYDPYPYWDTIMQAIKPQGRICLIVDSSGLVDLRALKDKSLTLTSEMMGTRIKYETEDMIRHHEILNIVSKKLETGELKCTLNRVLKPINAANLKEAHKLLENKSLIGKLVLSGF
ncbi:zinc-type alcohol dehydrogenase-like protein SERP1785 [Amyelois transitella]|uniref:zinc-type alcohol dehydrogenase-like protein SERP1785 n=1 Tax=Amyelois transitella TaxID=680683 RepID=UPI00067BD535|nr:zinc-type alcohol dehydrogenase-like protein SERP1785 [Amyelois transitella]